MKIYQPFCVTVQKRDLCSITLFSFQPSLLHMLKFDDRLGMVMYTNSFILNPLQAAVCNFL